MGGKGEVPGTFLQDGKVSRGRVLSKSESPSGRGPRPDEVHNPALVFHHVQLRALADVFGRVRVLQLSDVLTYHPRIPGWFGSLLHVNLKIGMCEKFQQVYCHTVH